MAQADESGGEVHSAGTPGAQLQALLLAVAQGATARAGEVADEFEVDGRTVPGLSEAISSGSSPHDTAAAIGDALAAAGAHRDLVNECYRAAFYLGPDSATLASNPLYAQFLANRAGAPVDKWVHYFEIYHRHLARYRGQELTVLEIGVYHGGGLDLIQHYLGSDARVIGLDIDEGARAAVGDRFTVELGDQADPGFLAEIAERYGPFDIVIDDGGHTVNQQIVSIQALFPHVRAGGTYVVEDCHTSYWEDYQDADTTFLEWAKQRVDDMHAYHRGPEFPPNEWTKGLDGLTFYDSVVVFDKGDRFPPFSEMNGTLEFLRRGRDQEAALLDARLSRDAVNRELNQVNHELSAANEELNGANEELNRVNHELNRVNHQLAEQAETSRRSWRRRGPAD